MTAAELIGQCKEGVVIHAMYDGWTPARGYVNYHGGIRFLTEVASARLASPMTLAFDQLGRGIGYDARQVAWNFRKGRVILFGFRPQYRAQTWRRSSCCSIHFFTRPPTAWAQSRPVARLRRPGRPGKVV